METNYFYKLPNDLIEYIEKFNKIYVNQDIVKKYGNHYLKFKVIKENDKSFKIQLYRSYCTYYENTKIIDRIHFMDELFIDCILKIRKKHIYKIIDTDVNKYNGMCYFNR